MHFFNLYILIIDNRDTYIHCYFSTKLFSNITSAWAKWAVGWVRFCIFPCENHRRCIQPSRPYTLCRPIGSKNKNNAILVLLHQRDWQKTINGENDANRLQHWIIYILLSNVDSYHSIFSLLLQWSQFTPAGSGFVLCWKWKYRNSNNSNIVRR